jgi:hypothetical protein
LLVAIKDVGSEKTIVPKVRFDARDVGGSKPTGRLAIRGD